MWCGILVPNTYYFSDLDVATQEAMGRLGHHLHTSEIKNPTAGEGETIGIPDADPRDVFPRCWDGTFPSPSTL